MSFRDELNALHKNNADFENVYENRSVQINQSYYDYFGMRVCELLKEEMRESVKNKQVLWENGIFKKKYYYQADVSFCIEHSRMTYAPNPHSTEGYYINEFPYVEEHGDGWGRGFKFLLSSWYSSDIYKALCEFLNCVQKESAEFSEIGARAVQYYAMEGYDSEGEGYKIGNTGRHHELLYRNAGGRMTLISTDYGRLFEGKNNNETFAEGLTNISKQRDGDVKGKRKGRGVRVDLTAKINCTKTGQII